MQKATTGDEPQEPFDPLSTLPMPAGPITVQVDPQGHPVTISIAPSFMPPMGGLESLPAHGLFGFGDAAAGEAERSGPLQAVLTNLEKALGELGKRVADFATNVATLEVTTYVSDSLATSAAGQGGQFPDARRRAYTSVKFDGDTDVIVPTDAGQLDEALWQIHRDTVAQAQAHREAMLKIVAELVSDLMPGIK